MLTASTNTFTGTSGNDSFDGSFTSSGSQTLNSGDRLDGGAGVDSLTAEVKSSVTPASLANIEVVDLITSATSTVDLSNGSAYTNVNSVAATAVLTLQGIGTGVAVGIQDTAQNHTLTFNSVTGTADSASLTLKNVTGGTLTVAGIETLNIASSGQDNTIGTLTAAQATKLVVSGDKALTITTNAATVATIDAAAATGAVTATVTPGAATVTGGAGNDAFTLAGTGAASVDGGAGNDTLTFGTTFGSTDTVKGGAGTDALAVDVDNVDAAAITTALTNVTGVETLRLSGFSDANTVNVANISAEINRVNLDAVSGASNNTLNMGSGAQTVGFNIAAAVAAGHSLTVDAAGTGTADSLAIVNMRTSTDDIGSATSNITVTDFETVSIATGTYSTAVGQNLGVVNAGSTTAVTVTGANSLTLAAGFVGASLDASGMTGDATLTMSGAATTVTSIKGTANADTLVGDASSSIDGGAGNDIITGGSGNDTLTGGDGNDQITAGTGNDNVQGGTGNDTLVFGADLAAGDSIDGGDGTDVLSITDASVNTLNGLSISGIIAMNNAISNVERVTLSDRLDRSVDVARLDAIETITLTSGINGNETLSGFSAAGGNVTILGASAAAGDELTLAVSADSAADAFTVNLTNNVNTDFSEVTLNDIERLNIVTAQATAADAVVTATFDVNAGVTNNTTALTTLTVTGTESLNLSGTALNAITVDATGLTATGTGANAALNFLGGNAAQSITGSAGADTIDASSGSDTINGGAGTDSLTGGSGNDVIDGGTGADSLTGGSGNDVIDGGTGADTILGGADVDSLTGGEGTDSITGGAGNDTIVLTETTSVADTVVINAVHNTSSDSARATVTGNDNDTGSDTIVGMAWGTDVIQVVGTGVVGFVHGTDTSIGTAIGDVNDGSAGSFLTSVGLINLDNTAATFADAGDIAINFSSSSAALTEARFEAAIQYNLTGSAAPNTITTGALNDTVDGGNGADVIIGAAGADSITGGAGNDTITLGAGSDVLVFTSHGAANADTITDYSVAEDSIHLSLTAFAGLGAVGALGVTAFLAGAGANAGTDEAHRIVYNTTSGELWFDSDGSAAAGAAAVLIGTFTGNPALVAAEFTIIT